MSEEKKRIDHIKEKKIIPRNIILAFGLFLMGAGILFFNVKETISSKSITSLRTFFLFVIGGLLFYRAMTKKKLSSVFFISLVILANVFLFIGIDIGLISYQFSQIWPIMVIVSGIVLVPTEIYKTGKVSNRFLVPAIVISSMGVFFLLFSLDIIKESFVEFASQWWSLFFILGGLFLVALFFYGRKKDSM